MTKGTNKNDPVRKKPVIGEKSPGWIGRFGFLLFLSSGILSYVTGIYVLLIIYSILGIIIASKRIYTLHAAKYSLIFLSIIFAIYLIHTVSGGNRPSADLRGFAFIIFAAINVFIIPQIVSEESFFWSSTQLSLVTVIVGLPSYISELAASSLDSNVYEWPLLFLTTSATGVPKFQSVLGNPNELGTVLLIGLLSSLILLRRNWSVTNLIAFLTISVSLFMTQSRGSIIAAFFSLFLFIIFIKYKGAIYRGFVLSGVFGLVLLYFLLISSVLPGPLSSVNLSYRGVLFYSGLDLVFERPILGWGPESTGQLMEQHHPQEDRSVHQSFLRLYITTGFIGGTSYLLFNIWSLIRPASTHYKPMFVIIGFGIFINQIFNEFTIFGLGLPSVLSAIVFGYLVVGRRELSE